MDRWEYMVVYLDNQRVVKVMVDGQPYKIPNKPLFGGAELSKFLSAVSDDGWDLITSTIGWLILKRPKS